MIAYILHFKIKLTLQKENIKPEIPFSYDQNRRLLITM